MNSNNRIFKSQEIVLSHTDTRPTLSKENLPHKIQPVIKQTNKQTNKNKQKYKQNKKIVLHAQGENKEVN